MPKPANNLFRDSRLILSTATVLKAGFRARVKAAQQAGFDGIGLSPQLYLDARSKENLSIRDMQDILAEHQVNVDEIDPLLDWMGPAASRSEQLIYEAADGLGAKSINVATAFAGLREQNELSDYFAGICERAEQHGLRVDLEFLPWTVVPDLTTALSLVRQAGRNNGGVMLDAWHFFRGGDRVQTIDNLSPEDAVLITSVQVCDADVRSAPLGFKDKMIFSKEMLLNLRDGIKVHGAKAFFAMVKQAEHPHPDARFLMGEALCSRLMPGLGEMPLTELLLALDSSAASPTVGIEVFALSSLNKPPGQLAEQAMQCYLHSC